MKSSWILFLLFVWVANAAALPNCSLNTVIDPKKCQCPSGSILSGNKCVPCPTGSTVSNNQCVCPSTAPSVVSNRCCPTGSTVVNNQCKCPSTSILSGNKCEACFPGSSIYNNQCLCPLNVLLSATSKCTCPSFSSYVGNRCCPIGSTKVENDKCVCGLDVDMSDTDASKCVCPTGSINTGLKCEACPTGSTVSNNQCVCPSTAPSVVSNRCCPTGSTVVNNECVCPSGQLVVGNKCESCPYRKSLSNGQCIDECVIGPVKGNSNCACPVNSVRFADDQSCRCTGEGWSKVWRANFDECIGVLPTGSIDLGDLFDIYPRGRFFKCPSAAPFNNNGACVNQCPTGSFVLNLKCFTCPSGTFADNGRCVTSCPSYKSVVYQEECVYSTDCSNYLKAVRETRRPFVYPHFITNENCCTDYYKKAFGHTCDSSNTKVVSVTSPHSASRYVSELSNLESWRYDIDQTVEVSMTKLVKLKSIYLDLSVFYGKTFDTKFNSFLDSIPNPTNLESLTMIFVKLRGATPQHSKLSRFTNLKEIILHLDPLDAFPSEICSLTKLEKMVFTGVLYRAPLPSCLANLINLKHFEIGPSPYFPWGHPVSGGVSVLGNLPKLETVILSMSLFNPGGTLPASFSKLKVLKVKSCFLSGQLPFLSANVDCDATQNDICYPRGGNPCGLTNVCA